MTGALHLLGSVARFGILVGGLLGPGAVLAGAIGVPRTVANCFAGSAAILYALVVAFTLVAIPITAATLVGGVGVISGVLVLIAGARRQANARVGSAENGPSPSAELAHASWLAPLRRMGRWTPLYVALIAIVIVRAVREPLAGPDVNFRWSFLAEQILRYGTLDFYPPRTAADFTRYFWVENIPPGVAALYAWTYVCAGKAAAIWTVPVVLLQYWTLHELTWRGAMRIGSERAARFACLILAGTPLLTWSVLLGQETGLTAIALLGTLVSLLEWRHTRGVGWAAIAGLFAALGAIAREYGLVFPILAVIGLAVISAAGAKRGHAAPGGSTKSAWAALLVAMVPLSLIWPVRATILTGNPFYSLPVGSLPTNRTFVTWINATAAYFGPLLGRMDTWRSVGRYVTNYAPGAIIGWFALGWVARRRDRVAAFGGIACVIVFTLWMASVPYTNGGLFYTMRVVSPALAVGTLASGCAMATWRNGAVAAFVVATVAIVALPVAWALPANPWTVHWRETTAFHASPASEDPVVTLVRTRGLKGPIVSDASGYQKLLAPEGVNVIPLWSPMADFLVDPRLTADEAARRWQRSGLHHVIITPNPVNLAYFATYAHWQSPPFHIRVIGGSADHVLLEIEAQPSAEAIRLSANPREEKTLPSDSGRSVNGNRARIPSALL